MLEALEPALLRLLRVPPEPAPPSGDAGSLQVFRAAPRYFLYRQLVWALKQVGALSALLFGLLFVERVAPNVNPLNRVQFWMRLGEAFAWAAFLLQLPFSYLVMQLDYRMRWYMVTDRSLRVREGVLRLREKTMTFANVQQLSVEQGPLQRLLGIADVHLQSAGGGAKKSSGHKGEAGHGESPHEARFRGVANAAELRDLVRERVRRYRDAGLGDHGDAVEVPVVASSQADALGAAQELLAEVRGLRGTLAGSSR